MGHALERAAPESDGFRCDWKCSYCGDPFVMPDEQDRRGMEVVETEDEPTGPVEATAIALQCAASTVQHDVKISSLAHHYTDHFAASSSWAAYGEAADEAARRGAWGRSRYAEAEALIRTGEVALQPRRRRGATARRRPRP